MTTIPNTRLKASVVALAVALLLLLPHAAFAHAVLVKSSPAQGATVKAGDVDITLTYNSRIDALHSSLHLVGPDGKAQTLAVDGACCAESPGGEGNLADGRRLQAGVAGAGQRWPYQPRRCGVSRQLTMRE